MIFLSGVYATTQVNYGEPVKIVSAEIDSPPNVVLDTICTFFQEQPKYEIKNKKIPAGVVTVQAKGGDPLRYIFIINQPSATKCTLIIRGLAGVDYKARRQDIPESVFNEMKNTMEGFMHEIKRRVKERK